MKELMGKTNDWGSFFVKLLIATGLTALIFTSVLSLTRLTSESMAPTMNVGDFVLGYRHAYAFGDPQRGDVVAFRWSVDDDQIVVKRIIGLPGETLEIRDGKVYLNGSKEPLAEPYLKDEWTVGNDGFSFEIPEDSYFMMGDDRDVSLDSRFWAEEAMKRNPDLSEEEAKSYAFATRDSIVSKLLFRLFPI